MCKRVCVCQSECVWLCEIECVLERERKDRGRRDVLKMRRQRERERGQAHFTPGLDRV